MKSKPSRTRTKYIKSVTAPTAKMLKQGRNNKKLGGVIQKASWKGLPVYSLTLEERTTCPTSCDQWDTCYGNNMPFAKRYDHTHPDFYMLLDDNLEACAMKHDAGFAVRLHVLGDFFDTEYVDFWNYTKHHMPQLRIWGYTHQPYDSEIGQAIHRLNTNHEDHCRVRFSDSTQTLFSTSVVSTIPKQLPQDYIVCPEQTHEKVKSCSTCTLCWESSDKHVVFLQH